MISTELKNAIVRLMEKFGNSQTGLAAPLKIDQGVVGNWIGKRGSSPQRPALRGLAKLARDNGLDKDARLFWREAGEDPATLWEQAESERFVGIKVLKDAAAAGPPSQINERDIDYELPIRRDMSRHPEQTILVPVKGDSMYPVLQDGYLAAVDTSSTRWNSLIKKMVLARRSGEHKRSGVTIKWLRKIEDGNGYVLMPQHVAPYNEPVVITNTEEWNIVGEVVFFIGKPHALKG